jgi:hypothetical protein
MFTKVIAWGQEKGRVMFQNNKNLTSGFKIRALAGILSKILNGDGAIVSGKFVYI